MRQFFNNVSTLELLHRAVTMVLIPQQRTTNVAVFFLQGSFTQNRALPNQSDPYRLSLFWTLRKRRPECLTKTSCCSPQEERSKASRKTFLYGCAAWAYWAYTFKIPLTGLDLPHVDIKPSTQQRSDCRRAHLSWSLAAAMTSPALVSDLLELIGINFSAEWSNNWRWAGVPLRKTS